MPPEITSVGGMPPPIPSPLDVAPGPSERVGADEAAPTSTTSASAGRTSRLAAAMGSDEIRGLLDKIDVLMTSAAKKSTVVVDAAEIRDTASSLLVGASWKDRRRAKTLFKLANAAGKSFAKVGELSGRDLAGALSADGKWVGKKGSIVKHAIADQIALSNELRRFVEEMGDCRDGTLFEAMFRCDRRMSELYTLAADMSRIAAQGVPSEAESGRLQAKARVLLPSKALEMHGTESAMAHIKREVLQPLADKLASFASAGDGGIHAGDINALRAEISEMRQAVSEMRGHGIVQDDGKSVVRPDSALLDGIVEVLDDVDAKVSDVNRKLGEKMIRRFFMTEVKDFCRFNPPLLPRNARIVAPELFEAARLRVQIDKNAREFESLLSNPAATHDQRRASLAAMKQKMSRLMSIDPLELVCQIVEYGDASVQFGGQSSGELWRALRRESYMLQAKLAHMDVMYERMQHMASDDFLTGRTALEVFAGRLNPTTLVEARIRGIADEDIDPALDDRNVRGVKQLGHGAANTVYAVTYNDDKTYVFKPESPGRDGLEFLYVGEYGAYDAAQQVVQLNIATSMTAKALGAEETVVKASAGAHGGMYGLFMEKAPGVTCKEFVRGGSGGGESLSLKDIQRLPPEARCEVKAGLMRGLNRLQWLDVITGQADRHHSNYMIDVRPGSPDSGKLFSVQVKGIDNDACFAKWRTGPHTFMVGPDKYGKFVQELEIYAGEAYGKGAAHRRFCDDFKRQSGVVWDDDAQTISIDLSKCGRTSVAAYITKKIFGFHSMALPELIDGDLCDHILSLGDDAEVRDRFLNDLESRLTPDAYEAAKVRLDMVIDHVRALKNNSPEKVISEDGWMSEAVQNHISHSRLAADRLDFSGVLRPVQGREASPKAVAALTSTLRYVNSDLYARDIASKVLL